MAQTTMACCCCLVVSWMDGWMHMERVPEPKLGRYLVRYWNWPCTADTNINSLGLKSSQQRAPSLVTTSMRNTIHMLAVGTHAFTREPHYQPTYSIKLIICSKLCFCDSLPQSGEHPAVPCKQNKHPWSRRRACPDAIMMVTIKHWGISFAKPSSSVDKGH
jgi:hypothetical protein